MKVEMIGKMNLQVWNEKNVKETDQDDVAADKMKHEFDFMD